ncbi:hypothetical protein MNBD_BACTEROID03-1488 [hydrothermal vent metagenome]|uniref:Uncharacterized protein n=1 Tax=hydrothermal vent metagenome TaxID=652676 RepID=A0A3B0T3I2_9ZZZZ
MRLEDFFCGFFSTAFKYHIRRKQPINLNFRVRKKASYLHRTATTIYPCCVPTLGDSTGAGRVGLANYKDTIF